MALLTHYRSLSSPRIVGLISGTSADGIDAIRVRLSGRRMEIEAFQTMPFPEDLRPRIFALMEDRATVREVARLNVILGELFAEAALAVMGEARADLVASHGQTVAHLPAEQATLQIGEPAIIAQRTGCLTVADFRPADVAAGGQGAPLVPYFDHWLLGSEEVDRVAVNIGGMANYTLLPRQGEILGGDTGPGNVLIDALTEMATGKPYDEGGTLGAQGTILPDLLEELLDHPYLALKGPKSTGREEFGREMARSLWDRGAPADLVRTATAFTAESLARVLRSHLVAGELVVGGGGVDNPVLMQELGQRLPGFKILRFEDFGVPSGAREAAAFALMGHETAHGRPSNVATVTGARGPRVLGKLVWP